ncbi:hypothetical protein [Roseomonas fluvialis]|uniref:Uncharacterized protein n=1 Tax=Roseomonas fluvialis TaxID=1750527 RepID=A0ABM7Y3Q6_9PROT|nr:hypothetical protein [Roseomonas fluvialis]BDG72481.1 hypothetical protein Rmf_24100 [Roseomonas fluvialis]
MSALGPSFTARMPRSLRQAGFHGRTVTVVLTADLVGLVGAEGGDRPIPIRNIAGLRAGLGQTTYGHAPELRLFLASGETLRLDPVADPGDAAAARRSYPDFVRALAQRLVATGHPVRIETGVGKASTAIFTGLIALPAAAMAAIAAWTWHDPPHAVVERWIARGFTSTLALVFAGFVYWFWRAQWPRRVAHPAALEAGLPRR